jgi:hypothetical protein
MASEWALIPGAKAVSVNSGHYGMARFGKRTGTGLDEFVKLLRTAQASE